MIGPPSEAPNTTPLRRARSDRLHDLILLRALAQVATRAPARSADSTVPSSSPIVTTRIPASGWAATICASPRCR